MEVIYIIDNSFTLRRWRLPIKCQVSPSTLELGIFLEIYQHGFHRYTRLLYQTKALAWSIPTYLVTAITLT